MEYKFSNKLARLKPSAIREIFKSLSDPNVISFAAGNPAAESFPIEDIRHISADILERTPIEALQYSRTEGYPPLCDALRARLSRRGIGTPDDEILVTSGGNQGIELTAKVLCNEGDAVICEEPSFIGALNAFRSNGARTIGVPLEADGIDVAALGRVLEREKRARLIYLIPNFQNPAGITTSQKKRREIYELALKFGVPILEDDPYGELRFAGEDVPTIKSIDREGAVIYCSSFSKILSAGMRVGYVCAPAPIVQKLVVAKQVEDVHTNIHFQMLCHRYMTECDIDAHIRDIRAIYRHKCALMLSGLERELPSSIAFTRPEGGLFVLCTLPEGAELDRFVAEALRRGVAVVPGSAFLCDPEGRALSFRLNYSTPSDDEIVEGCRRLGEAARALGLS